MSDTPETDHLEVQLGKAATHSHPILWEHSRKMERERDEARNDLDNMQDQRDLAMKVISRLERERDEAREMVENLTKHGLNLMDENRIIKRKRNEAEKKIQRQAERIQKLEGATNHAGGTPLSIALRERDEARELAHRFRSIYYSKLGIESSASRFPWEDKLGHE